MFRQISGKLSKMQVFVQIELKLVSLDDKFHGVYHFGSEAKFV